MEQFPIWIMQNVFVSDSKLSSHPIVYNVHNADDIAAVFDDISYQKVYKSNILIIVFILFTNFFISFIYSNYCLF